MGSRSSSDVAGAAGDQHAALGLTNQESVPEHTKHPEARWFPKAGLGFFITWGVGSVHGKLDLSWGMMAGTPYDASEQGRNKVTPREYWRLADRFQPDRYDPDKWISAAAKAGFQYAVLTVMHHEGYTLWPTGHGDFGTHTHMGGRDLIRPYVEACRKYGLKVGLYYSPPDWYFDREYMSFHYRSDDQQRFPGRDHFGGDHQPVELPLEPETHAVRRRALFHKRVEELLTRYGRIDVLWFDGGVFDNEIRDRARELQPWLVINNRSCEGDFGHTECYLPETRFEGWFETCHCWQASDILLPDGKGTVDVWGYRDQEQFKSTAWMLETLVKLRAWGGNLLINVGPRPNGELPDVVYDRLKETQRWMEANRESVIGTEAGCWPERCNVPVTVSEDRRTYYLHLLPGFRETVVLEDVPEPRAAWLVGDAKSAAVSHEGGRLSIDLPMSRRTELVDVIAVQWDQPREPF